VDFSERTDVGEPCEAAAGMGEGDCGVRGV
jgi:hypothetical protein